MKAKRVTMTFAARTNSTVDGPCMHRHKQQHAWTGRWDRLSNLCTESESHKSYSTLALGKRPFKHSQTRGRELQIWALTQAESTCSLSDHPSTKNTKGGFQTSLSRKQQPRGGYKIRLRARVKQPWLRKWQNYALIVSATKESTLARLPARGSFEPFL